MANTTDNGWIQTYMGKAVPLIDPQPEHIDIRDIAHALACFNRYTGHAFRPYSVGQHSLHVAERAGGWDGKHFTKPANARYGLLHDASEAYVGDISSPLKRIIKHCYAPIEQGFMLAVLLKFGVELNEEIEAAVVRADLELLAQEKRDLLGPEPKSWELPYEAPMSTIDPWIWRTAEMRFLEAFYVLFPEHR